MISTIIGARQKQLLSLLLPHKNGLTIDKIADSLEISRTAVQQHITSLEAKGYIERGKMTKTGGRPVQNYVLTDFGINLFPKQYAWFSEVLLTELKQEFGSEWLEQYLRKLGAKISASLRPQLERMSRAEQVNEVIRIMQDLGYEATLETTSPTETPTINACNCVYHGLAKEHNEVCKFDIALISCLLNRDVEHIDCMARGDNICSFKIDRAKSPAKNR